MHNKLSFMNSFCVLLFIGKIGHIGTLGAVPWLLVFLPLALDLILDFLLQLGYVDAAITRLKIRIKAKELMNLANRQNKNTNA